MAPTNSAITGDKINYALQVALQTMKERCKQLQQQVSKMEEENLRLREGTNTQTDSGDSLTLQSQVSELQRQKEQLEEQINMVSNENRRLWSRLSQISKDQQLEVSQAQTAAKNDDDSATDLRANQNLIRSKTFTQHSPNPHLRQKMISDEMSLEEIALDDFGANDSDLGYPYGLQVPIHETGGVSTDFDANLDAKRCMDGLQDLRREAMKQQQELTSALTLLENRIALQPCPECVQKAAHKPETADKSLETDESLNNELKQYDKEHIDASHNGHDQTHGPTPPRLNIIQEKIQADGMEKTCPMCGKLYSSQISFKAFREHVEMHFIDETIELENNSIDRQFEFVSHTVGDF
ncbi:protein spindle-F [Drosophila tropicalis]|uniref:protein spindle-F n=1 Tax=Drosophila tropicalis TaxID=46794 RepID=UPI0035ABA469